MIKVSPFSVSLVTGFVNSFAVRFAVEFWVPLCEHKFSWTFAYKDIHL